MTSSEMLPRGGGSVWVATLRGLIQVDPATMDATWHTDLALGKKIVYAFDSLWIGGTTGVIRVAPTSLARSATATRSDRGVGVEPDELRAPAMITDDTGARAGCIEQDSTGNQTS